MGVEEYLLKKEEKTKTILSEATSVHGRGRMVRKRVKITRSYRDNRRKRNTIKQMRRR